jgi:hypothetical protein
MNIADFLPFLVHSSIHPPFDEFLISQKIIWRPKVGRKLDTLHFIAGTGISLSFDLDASAKTKGISMRSEGSFVFSRLDVMIVAVDKKDGYYVGPLTRGLVAQDTSESIEQKLGTPRRRNTDSDNYYLDDLVWTVAFDDNKFQFMQFDVPSDDRRAHGLCTQ